MADFENVKNHPKMEIMPQAVTIIAVRAAGS